MWQELSALKGMRIPMILIAGSDDETVPPSQIVGLARTTLPKAQVAIIPECGHLSHEEAPEELLVRRYIPG